MICTLLSYILTFSAFEEPFHLDGDKWRKVISSWPSGLRREPLGAPTFLYL